MQTSSAGRLEVGDLVGRGGLADVYAARDPETDQRLAVKRLRRPDAGAAQRLAREAEVLRSLDHPSIPHLYDVVLDDERPFLVVELIDGTVLADVLRGGPLQLDRARSIGEQVADALAHAHARGVVHRDVKPGNLLLDRDGRVHLIDFGVARDLDADTSLTNTGLVVGTVAYLAPEQVKGDDITGAADVYSLGLMLLECVTGERAYPGGTLDAALARMARPPTIPDELPAWFASLIRAMTEIDPAARPTATAVAEHLRAGTAPSADPVVVVAADDDGQPGEDDTIMAAWNPPTTVLPIADVAAVARPDTGPADRWSPRALALGAVGLLFLLGALLVGLASDGRPAREPSVPVASTIVPTTGVPEPSITTAPPPVDEEGKGNGKGRGHGNDDD